MSTRINLPAPADLLPEVVRQVRRAGALIRAEFHRPGGPRGKPGKCPVDVQIEAELMEALLRLHPCDWLGEELPRPSAGHEDCWAVDPQDGTGAFQRGLRGSAVSVALLRAGRPVLGVVLAPTAPDDGGDLFAWAEGTAARRNGLMLAPIGPDPRGEERPGRPAGAGRGGPAGGYGHATVIAMNEEAGDFAAHNHRILAPAAVLALPSVAYRLALAAAGEVDAAVSLTAGLGSHDIAAGHALLIGVGGALCDLQGRPVVHGAGAAFHGCIGGRPEIVAEVLRRGPSVGARVPRQPARPVRRSPSGGQLDRAQGALLGLLAGDALGAQVEFLDPATIRRRHPQGLRSLGPGGTWSLLAGQPTDDGELALTLARALVARGGFDREAVARAYADWLASAPFDVGTTTAQGIRALAGQGHPAAGSQANGALMRVAPIGIAAAGDPSLAALWAREDAALTHPHPLCREASAAFAAAVAAGVAGADPLAMWSAALAQTGHDAAGGAEVRQALLESRDRPPADVMRHQGWVLTAFANAFHRLWIGQDVETALCETVHAGGDTDTNAAIAGALLGAACGRSGIPAAWRTQLRACRAVKAEGVVHPRPAALWADDAMDLAEALLVLRPSAGRAG